MVREDHALAVRGERVVGPEIHLREAFLLVTGHAPQEGALGAGFQIARDEHGVVVAAADEDHRLAVGGERRAHGSSEAARQGERLSGQAIEPCDLPETPRKVGDVVEPARAPGEVEESAVSGGDRPGGVVQVVGGGQLDPAAAVAVVHPELHRRDPGALRLLFARDQVDAVRRPRGAADVGVLLRRERAGVLSVGVDEPQVLHSAAVARERDRLPVGREAGVVVVARSAGERARVSSGDGQGVEVAQEVEEQGLAVGGNVDGHPRAVAHFERHRAGVGARRVDVRRGVLLARLCRRRADRDRRREEKDAEDEHSDRTESSLPIHTNTSCRKGEKSIPRRW